MLELGLRHLRRVAIAWKQDIPAYHFLLQRRVALLVVLVIDGIAIAVHLVDGIIGRCVYACIRPVVDTVFGIKEIGHLHAFLYVILRQLQHDVGLLCYGGNHQMFHADRIVLLVGMFGIVDEFCQLHPIFAEQDSRVFSLSQFPCEHPVHLHAVAMVHIHIDPHLLSYDMAHLDEAPYLIERGDVLRLQPIHPIVQRIGASQQLPCPVNLTIARCPLQHQALLGQPLESSYGSEEWIALQVAQRLFHIVHLLLQGFRGVPDGFNAFFQHFILGRYLDKHKFQETVLLRVVRLYMFLHAIQMRLLTSVLSQFVLDVGWHPFQLVGP